MVHSILPAATLRSCPLAASTKVVFFEVFRIMPGRAAPPPISTPAFTASWAACNQWHSCQAKCMSLHVCHPYCSRNFLDSNLAAQCSFCWEAVMFRLKIAVSGVQSSYSTTVVQQQNILLSGGCTTLLNDIASMKQQLTALFTELFAVKEKQVLSVISLLVNNEDKPGCWQL